jgi:ribosome-associated protein
MSGPVSKPKEVARETVMSWAVLAARAADDKKATDTRVLDVGRILAIADMFVIASAPSGRQVKSITDEIEDRLKSEVGISPLRIEGLRDLTWVLLDYGDVVVHVFSDEMRAFYEIERLYRDAVVVDWQATDLSA